jgi:hypothetical protein
MVPIEQKDGTREVVSRWLSSYAQNAAIRGVEGLPASASCALPEAEVGSRPPARSRADCRLVLHLIVVRAPSVTGKAIAFVRLAEAAGGDQGCEALVEGGGADAAARAQLGKGQRAVAIGERGGDTFVDGTGHRRLRCARFEDFEREGLAH